MKALVTVASHRQFQLEGNKLTHLDELGNPKHQLTIRTAPILKPGVAFVYGTEGGTVVNEGVITGVLLRR